MNASVYQEPEKDSAIIGGIVSGLGGPGVLAAVEAEIDNVRIREENRIRREAMKKKTDEMAKTLIKASLQPGIQVDYKKQYCIDYNTDPEILVEGISINENDIKIFYDRTTGCHEIIIPWKAVSGKPCIDGHFICELYNKQRFAGECKVPLPTNGTFFAKNGELEAYFPRLEVSGPYTVVLRIGEIHGIHINKEVR
jgi:hypothetical protein